MSNQYTVTGHRRTLSEEARELGVPRSTLWARRQKSIQTPGFQEAYLGTTPDDVSDQELWDLTSSVGHKLVALREETELLDVTLPAEAGPVALAFTGDWHLGNRGTDMHLLEDDLAALASTPGLYTVGMGDYLDNYKPNMGRVSEGMYDASLPNPEDQRRLASHGLRTIRASLLGATRGCHLDWDGRVGYDPLADMLRGLGPNSLGNAPANLGYGGVIKLHVGEQTYSGLVRHKYGNAAALNSTNSHRRAANEYPVSTLWDFVALAHLHHNDLQIHEYAGHDQIWVRSGSYKVLDTYGQRLGGLTGDPGVPVIIFHPEDHRMLAFYGHDLSVAIQTLAAMRRGDIAW